MVKSCSGDSGGPQFVEEDGRRSSGLSTPGETAPACINPEARVDPIDEWILDFVEDVHGTRECFCEANGWHG